MQEFVFIIIIFFLFFRLIGRNKTVFIVNKVQNFYPKDPIHESGQQQKKEGEITIDASGKKKNISGRDSGQYVDFVEIK